MQLILKVWKENYKSPFKLGTETEQIINYFI